MTMGNCYSNALHSPGLGDLKPGGLALAFGNISAATYRALWDHRTPQQRENRRVYLGACMSGLSLDGIQLSQTPLLPRKRNGQYLLALFTKETGGYLDFHLAHSKPNVPGWGHHHFVQYGEGEPLIIVEEEIPQPQLLEAEGLWGYDFQTFAEIPPGLHAKLGF